MERFLAQQGVFPAQPTTFLSDGGETVRQAQGDFRQFGEPILDWFHVAMRMTQLSQTIKGLPADPTDEPDPPKHTEECLRILRRAKAYLWHGSPHRALQTLEDLTWEIGTESEHAKAIQDKLEEFMGYVTANLTSIPNYADRQRHGEPIATGFVESAVNQVVSKRLVKKQQMRWTPTGAHHLLQVRTPCSISSCAGISSAGTRGSNLYQPHSVWRRSTQYGPLSHVCSMSVRVSRAWPALARVRCIIEGVLDRIVLRGHPIGAGARPPSAAWRVSRQFRMRAPTDEREKLPPVT